MTRVFTIGHGTRPLDELTTVLHEAGIEVLVDVRRYPGSRRNPQFGRDELAAELPAGGVAYEWWGEELGGRRKGSPDSPNTALRNAAFRAYADYMATAAFNDALDALLSRAETQSVAVMCAETLWWRCHRRLIADVATVRGYDVVHLGAGKPQRHQLEPSARITDNGHLVYDGGALPLT
jgi:uncharacterized protein (DUF488 family)